MNDDAIFVKNIYTNDVLSLMITIDRHRCRRKTKGVVFPIF